MKNKKSMIGIILCAVLLVAIVVFNIVVGMNIETMAYNNRKVSAELTRAESTAAGQQAAINIQTEGTVLLKNEGNILPLNQGSNKTKVTLVGARVHNYVQGGTGSAGGRDDNDTVMFNKAMDNAGIDYNKEAWTWLTDALGGGSNMHNGAIDKSKLDAADPLAANASWTGYTAIPEIARSTHESKVKPVIGAYKTAVIMFSRTGAEGATPSIDFDGNSDSTTGRTYFELTDTEIDLLDFCNAEFDNTIVLVNSATPMEVGFIDNPRFNIKGALWVGHMGESGLQGVADILSGRATPSGRTPDTWAYDLMTDPTYYSVADQDYATQDGTGSSGIKNYQYNESIYSGYRWYETADAAGYWDSTFFKDIKFKGNLMSAAKYDTLGSGETWATKKTDGPKIQYSSYNEVVQFPFGYGLSYTSFSQTIKNSNIKLTAGGQNTVTVTVKNTGSTYSGKEVVQVYMEAPYAAAANANFGLGGKAGLEQSKIMLVGFGKTEILAPGASQDVTVTFSTDEVATYDQYGQGSYVLVGGEYKFYVSPNAHGWKNDSTYGNNYGSVTATLSNPIIYKSQPASGAVSGATYVEKRSGEMYGVKHTENQSAVNQMNDVTAGDGAMLINGGASGTYDLGYLSRSNFTKGMAEIMSFQTNDFTGATVGNGNVFGTTTPTVTGKSITRSNIERNARVVSESVRLQIQNGPIKKLEEISGATGYNGATSGLIGVYGMKHDYGAMVASGIKFGDGKTASYHYGYGNDSSIIMQYTPDGKLQNDNMYKVEFGKTYWVAANEDGETVKAQDGYVAVYETESDANATSGYTATKLQVNHMAFVPEEDDRWTQITNMISFAEADKAFGDNGWKTAAIDSVGKPLTVAVDGPGEAGNAQNAGCTWWPCAVIIAATWNPDCAENDYGVNYGIQALLNNTPYVYAPAMNTHRTPFGGRNFEYYSEDGLLAGVQAGHSVKGIQSRGVHVFVKHMGYNESDANRGGVLTFADEASSRMVWHKPYEISVKYFGTDGIMGSLPRVGMAWSHRGLYTEILRNEWGFAGHLITDGDGNANDSYNNYSFWAFSTEGGPLNQSGTLIGNRYVTADNAAGVAGLEAIKGSITSNGDNATDWVKYTLHKIAGNVIYQYSHNYGIVAYSLNYTPGMILLIVVNIVLGLALIVTAVICFVVPLIKKRKGNA